MDAYSGVVRGGLGRGDVLLVRAGGILLGPVGQQLTKPIEVASVRRVIVLEHFLQCLVGCFGRLVGGGVCAGGVILILVQDAK